jgi:hypothetical protein
MAETFYGPWWLEVSFGIAHSNERFTIVGSDSSDGVYTKRELEAGIGKGPGTVSGQAWSITMDYSPFGFLDIGQIGDFIMGQWYPSGIRRSASYTLKDNLVVTLTSDYTESAGYAARPDNGDRGLILICKSLNPSHRPGPPIFNPFDFTLPRESISRYRRKKAAFNQVSHREER